ncbi:hypothetical protein NMG60_11000721 [Bertholletia excelsa]
MSSMNEKLKHIPEGEVVQQGFAGQPSVDLVNINASEEQKDIFSTSLQQIGTTKTEGRQHRKSGIPISLEDIQQQFGKKLEDAAESIGVSRSTLKRACREYQIFWWQSGKRKGGRRASPGASVEDASQYQVPPFDSQVQVPIFDSPHRPPTATETSSLPTATETSSLQNYLETMGMNYFDAKVMATDTSRQQNYLRMKGMDNVDIKVIYGDKYAIKFQLSLSSGLAGLKQQVVKRLNWVNFETCNFQYKDEDDDWILIACDEDLLYYLNTSSLLGKNIFTIYLRHFNIFFKKL